MKTLKQLLKEIENPINEDILIESTNPKFGDPWEDHAKLSGPNITHQYHHYDQQDKHVKALSTLQNYKKYMGSLPKKFSNKDHVAVDNLITFHRKMRDKHYNMAYKIHTTAMKKENEKKNWERIINHEYK